MVSDEPCYLAADPAPSPHEPRRTGCREPIRSDCEPRVWGFPFDREALSYGPCCDTSWKLRGQLTRGGFLTTLVPNSDRIEKAAQVRRVLQTDHHTAAVVDDQIDLAITIHVHNCNAENFILRSVVCCALEMSSVGRVLEENRKRPGESASRGACTRQSAHIGDSDVW